MSGPGASEPITSAPDPSAPGASAPDPSAPGASAPDPSEAGAGASGPGAATAPRKRARKSSSDDAPGLTAMMVAVFGWETVSDGNPVWMRIVAALFALLGVVELARFAVRRRRARR
ncbi:hypothetical protein [Streptomyces tanashiensis]|uniref:Uncharacterized protein n=1 Tax=Streptomyces tanashiensis TaxID=67367 RepID=A0ABY6R4I0_9ACTN|nr:hypothetical protein [Streptomyces tanashiensis]UZX23594.1 hypothetical protein LDH80_24020 [Streptomyces tanashiensis]